ncbi:hypothetical protein RHGRI_025786 [Rhododendron griersonianum]|uniref:Uncharacterized protein n=1 Tax=Rhododendron griersonianum TaxID=479676 RepID=A0AAV6IVU7_9ERIC|nr:hypothetical protein RHGRI_025786 [Rhododendron griersonianum]
MTDTVKPIIHSDLSLLIDDHCRHEVVSEDQERWSCWCWFLHQAKEKKSLYW